MLYFRHNYAQSSLQGVLLVIFALIAVASPIATVLVMQEEKKVIIMDQAGNYHQVIGSSFPDAKKLHLACAKAAATALLTRTPDGVLYPELLKQTFTINCADWLRTHVAESEREFELKKIRQIPEVKNIRILDQGNGRYMAHLRVYLTRSCEFDGITFVEHAEALLSFEMAENPDISRNGHLPLVVYHIKRCDIQNAGGKKS